MTVFLIKSFNGSLVLNKRNDNLAVFCNGSLLYNNNIAVENSSVYHRITLYFKGKHILSLILYGNRDILLYALNSQNRFTCGNRSYKRNLISLCVIML